MNILWNKAHDLIVNYHWVYMICDLPLRKGYRAHPIAQDYFNMYQFILL